MRWALPLAGLLLSWSASASAAVFPGPDEFGYNGNEITAVLRGVSATGAPVPLGDDELSAELPIGFTFDFYGIEYSTFRISSNGFITLGSGPESQGCCSGLPIPSPSSPNNFVSGWWTDLNNPSGNIRFQTLGDPGGRELVVGFYDVPHYYDGPRVTFEIVLHEGSNEIEIQCWSCPSNGRFHTTGIENADGSIGLQIASTASSQPRTGWLISAGTPPDCSAARATRGLIWPPNLHFVEVGIRDVTDPGGDPISVRIDEIRQDEALGISANPISADAWGIGSDLARVRAGRRVPGDGRVYHVRFTASDSTNLSCSETVTVCVPSQRGRPCTDQGPLYDSSTSPSLESSDPAPGSASVPRTAWIRFELKTPLRDLKKFELICGGAAVQAATTRIGARTVLINPAGTLAPGAFCNVRYTGGRGREEFHFRVAPGEGSETVFYDRIEPTAPSPFPDDYWLVDDPTTASGKRLQVTFGDIPDFLTNIVSQAVADAINDRDGFSPIQDFVLPLSQDADPASLPGDEFGSIDPAATVGLFDMDPTSPSYGKRVPFNLRVRNDAALDGVVDHSGILFPAVRLNPRGRYAFVVTRRLYAAGDPSRPFLPSAFFERVAAAPSPDDSAQIIRARQSIGPVLDFLASQAKVPIPREDIALALSISIRSEAFDPSDLIAIKENYLAGAPPEIHVDSVSPIDGRAALLEGTVDLPLYLDPRNPGRLNRDPETGRPMPAGFDSVPFVLTLPEAAEAGPVPIVFYQHGRPGSPYEILGYSNEFLDDAGYAIGGIQDYLNRTYGENGPQQTFRTILHLLSFRRYPLVDFQSYADMMGFLRAIQGLDSESWLPLFAPDSVPEIEPSRILFRGVSWGSINSLAFLPFAPEIAAAASVVGGGRQSEQALHQFSMENPAIPGARPVQLLVGLAALQGDLDRQDSHLLARHLYREPLAVNGQSDSTPPSLLLIEGIGDPLTPNNATRAAANELGIPAMRPVQRATPVLEQVDAPLAENLGPDLTAGHFQYDPFTTPSCRDLFFEFDGHFCPQIALEAEAQTLHFFETALDPNRPAEIIDPFLEELSLPAEEARSRVRLFRASDVKQ